MSVLPIVDSRMPELLYFVLSHICVALSFSRSIMSMFTYSRFAY